MMENREKCCLRILKQIRPQWQRKDIILWELSDTSWAGYSINNIKEKLYIKIWKDEDEVSMNPNSSQTSNKLSKMSGQEE